VRPLSVDRCPWLAAGQPDDEALVASDEVIDELTDVPVRAGSLLGPLVRFGPAKSRGDQVLRGLELSDVHASDTIGYDRPLSARVTRAELC
jgi:hypothetical protein